jgi:hypothetical protein
MAEHMYKVIEVIGSSSESWEKAAAMVIEHSSQHLQDLRIAEVTQQDVQIAEGRIVAYRVKLKLSFKYHGELHG